jgi:hypothetical protein
MQTIFGFFTALLAIPVVQVACAPRLARAGAPVLMDRSSKILLADGKQLRTREIGDPMSPRSERRPKAS